MKRLKIMVASLLPLLWLAATASGFTDAPGCGAGCGQRASISAAAGSGQRDPVGNFNLSKQQALRNLSRRAGMSCASDGKSLPLISSASGLPRLERGSSLFSVVEAPADLVRCWQFYMRTASEPRAPSVVS
jgi:hypothetical protein